MISPLLHLRELVMSINSSDLSYPEAFALCTCGTKLKEAPSSRIVLAKEITEDSIYFYTNYESQKALEMARIPNVSGLFYFDVFGIQVRVKGEVMKLGEEESDEYWESRSYLSRVGACVSKQSRILPFKWLLYWKVLYYVVKHGKHVPRPKNWGGYVISVNEVEMFYMKSFRLHTRVNYKLDGKTHTWSKETLYP